MTWVKPWNLGSNLKIGCEMRFEPLFWHFLFFVWAHLKDLFETFFCHFFFVWGHLRNLFDVFLGQFFLFGHIWETLLKLVLPSFLFFEHTWGTSLKLVLTFYFCLVTLEEPLGSSFKDTFFHLADLKDFLNLALSYIFKQFSLQSNFRIIDWIGWFLKFVLHGIIWLKSSNFHIFLIFICESFIVFYPHLKLFQLSSFSSLLVCCHFCFYFHSLFNFFLVVFRFLNVFL